LKLPPRERRAVSPAISTVILTGAIIVLLSVAIVFANNFLNARMAEDEFNAVKQFMQSVALQMDDVAWTIGRTQTIRYACKFGAVDFEQAVLTYTVFVNGTVCLGNYTTGALLFNMPIDKYSVGNGYYEDVFPSNRSFLHVGASAPVGRVYVVEKIPMYDGGFVRVVVVPTIRMFNSTISLGGNVTNYYKFYLPVLSSGVHSYKSQSVTLTGRSVSVETGGAYSVKISVSFPMAEAGFDSGFFNFQSRVVEMNVPSGSVVEFYTGDVAVSLGLHA
jgi:hypothetical protein